MQGQIIVLVTFVEYSSELHSTFHYPRENANRTPGFIFRQGLSLRSKIYFEEAPKWWCMAAQRTESTQQYQERGQMNKICWLAWLRAIRKLVVHEIANCITGPDAKDISREDGGLGPGTVGNSTTHNYLVDYEYSEIWEMLAANCLLEGTLNFELPMHCFAVDYEERLVRPGLPVYLQYCRWLSTTKLYSLDLVNTVQLVVQYAYVKRK